MLLLVLRFVGWMRCRFLLVGWFCNFWYFCIDVREFFDVMINDVNLIFCEVIVFEVIALVVDGYCVIDVCELYEWDIGYVAGVILLLLVDISQCIVEVELDWNVWLLLHCVVGV